MSGCKFDCRAEVVVLACKVVVDCGMVDDEILGVVRAASQEEVGLDHTNVVVPVMPEEGGLWVGKTLALSGGLGQQGQTSHLPREDDDQAGRNSGFSGGLGQQGQTVAGLALSAQPLCSVQGSQTSSIA
jgi:hypothetical protein